MSFEIDHLGIAVDNLDGALKIYRDLLGATVASRECIAQEAVNVAVLPAGGSHASIELLEATDASSPIARFIAKHGPGLHHIALRVHDLAATVAKLEAAGHRPLNQPQIGAAGHRYVFLHPRSSGGVLLELVESVST